MITETRRTTEATMRMEHKISFPDFPLSLSQRTQTPTIPCVSAGTMFESDVQTAGTNTETVFMKSGSTQTVPMVPAKPVRTLEASTSITGFPVTQLGHIQQPPAQLYEEFPTPSTAGPLIQFEETRQALPPFITSETRSHQKSAFEYFENKITTSQLPQDDKYTKFEDVMKLNSKSVPLINQNLNTWQQPPTQDNHLNSSINDDMLAFNLEPGQPPEIGYMPKIDLPKIETLRDKVQKLEEIQKQVTDVPTGGVSVFPDYNKFEFSQQQTQSSQQSFMESKQEIKYEPIYRPQAEPPRLEFRRTPSPRPSVDSSSFYQTSEDCSRTNIARSPSPRPSAEGIAMEKLWSNPKGTDFMYKRAASPKPTLENGTSYSSSTKEYSSVCYNQPAPQVVPPTTVYPVRQSPALIDFDTPIQQVQLIEPPTHDFSQQQQEVVVKKQSILETKKMFEEKIKQNEMPVRSTFMNQTDLKAPAMVKQIFPKPKEEPLFMNNLNLEPGTPPEMCYAPRTTLERKQSYVEAIEKSLLKDLEKEPTRVPPGGVRVIPSPIARQASVPPVEVPVKKVEVNIPIATDTALKNVDLIGKPLVLEEHHQTSKSYMESDYESDFDISRNSSTWKPYESDSDATGYRHVTPVQFKAQPTVQQPQPFQSSHFESFESKQESHITKPKVKVSSGYMADTDEPTKFLITDQFNNNITTKTFNQTESKTYSSSFQQHQQLPPPQLHYPILPPQPQIPIPQQQQPQSQPKLFKPQPPTMQQQSPKPVAQMKPTVVPSHPGNYAKVRDCDV